MEPWEQYSQPQAAAPSQEPWEQYGGKSEQEPSPDIGKLPWYLQAALKGPGGIVHDAANSAISNAGNAVSDVGQSLVNRTGEAAQTERDYQAGKISLPVAMVQQVGKLGGGTAGDIMGAVIKNFTPDAVTNGLQQGAQTVAGKIDAAAPQVGNAALTASNAVGEFAKKNPQTYKTLESVGDLVNIPPAYVALKAAAPAVRGTGNALSRTGQGMTAASDIKSVTKQVGSESLYDLADQSYKAADSSGGVIAPSATNKWLDASAKVLPQTDEGKLYAGDTVATQKLERLSALRDKPLTFKGADEIDKAIGGDITKAFRAGDNTEAARLMGIQDNLREAIDTLPETSEHIKQAKALFSAAKKQEDVENILKRAEGKDNPATVIKNGFSTLLNNKNRIRGYSDAEAAAIRNAANTGKIGDGLRGLGSRLHGIVALATGHPAGAIAANIGSQAARAGATALQAGRAGRVSEAILARPAVQTAIQGAMDSGELLPKFTALKALGVTLDKAGNLLRGGKPFTMREAMQLAPSVAKPALTEMKLLAAPGKLTPLPMTDREIALARRQMEQPPQTGADTSGSAIRLPVSQTLKVEGSANWIQGKQFQNLQQKLLNGDISQNQFVETVRNTFKLNREQARSLANEVKTYGAKQTP